MSAAPGSASIALVTGANKGIGLETARRLVEAGYRVHLAARSRERGQVAAETVGAQFLELDVTSDESVRRAADSLEQSDGHLDVLVDNAGITGPLRDVRDYDGNDAATILLTDVVGYVRVIHAFLPLLERADDPGIVNVSSGIGSFGLSSDENRIGSRAGTSLYGAAKAGINMLTARYARLLPHIRINVADSGTTATDLSGGPVTRSRPGPTPSSPSPSTDRVARPAPSATATAVFPGKSTRARKDCHVPRHRVDRQRWQRAGDPALPAGARRPRPRPRHLPC